GLVEAATDEQVVAEVRAADERGEPLLVLGGGSNLVVADGGFPGTVVHVATRGVRRGGGRRDRHGNGQDMVELTVAAGEDWDAVVEAWVGKGLAGLECLSGIPGRAGATPIQNVGAYGQEVAERIISVRVYDRERGAALDLAGPECGFGYRTSAFKRSLQAQRPPAGPAAVTGRVVGLNRRVLLARARRSAPARSAPRREAGHRSPPSAPPSWACAGPREWCWTRTTRTPGASAPSSSTRFSTASASPRWNASRAPSRAPASGFPVTLPTTAG